MALDPNAIAIARIVENRPGGLYERTVWQNPDETIEVVEVVPPDPPPAGPPAEGEGEI